MHRGRLAGAWIALGAIVSSCSGPQGAGALPGTSSNAARSVAASARLEVALTIPRRVRAHFVSPSTKSMTVTEGKTKLGTFETTPTAKGCKNINGTTLCRFTLGIKTGKETFTVKTFDQPGGKGNVLSSGRVTQKILPGLNVVGITLSGVVHSIVVALVDEDVPAGTPATIGVNVMAKDPDGNVIIAPGNFGVPIALSNSDRSGITALSSTTVTGPSADVTLAYDGRSITSATLDASASGVSPSNVTAATFAPAPIVVGNFILPLATDGGSLEPIAIASGGDGNLWFSFTGDDSGIMRMTTDGTMNAFKGGIISNLPSETFTGLVGGSDGNVWYVGTSDVGNITPSGVVADYPLTGGGLCGSPSGNRIINAADGGFWISITCSNSATAGQLAHITRSGTISTFTLTGFSIPQGLVLGKDGNVYLAGTDIGSGNDAVAQVVNAAGGSPTISFVDIPNTHNSDATTGVTQTADGDIWVATTACDPSVIVRIHLGTPFTASNVAPFDTLAGCEHPAFLRGLSDGAMWVPEDEYPVVTRVLPGAYPAAPSLADYAVPVPHSVYGQMWDVVAGPDGDLYFTDYDNGNNGFSSNVIKVAY